MSDYYKRKEYKLPNGRTVTADFDELGIAKITIQAMDALFDILNSSEKQWTPCSERLPEVNREILITEKGGFIRHCEYANYGDFQEFQTVEEGMTVDDVIAWMPLPEPYKGEESC